MPTAVDLLRESVSDYLTLRSIRRHRSRIGWRTAPLYSKYLQRCRDSFAGPLPALEPAIASAVAEFRRDGVTSFATPATTGAARSMHARLREREAAGDPWLPLDEYGNRNYRGDAYNDFPEIETLCAGPVGGFLTYYFGAHFKLLYAVLYKSAVEAGHRRGSQLWHSDGGPGICVNVMYYLHETDAASGALEALPWDAALEIYARERRALRQRAPSGAVTRDARCAYYGEAIERDFADRVRQPTGPAGLVVPFLNNTLHRGGYPAPGRERYAIVFHAYPSHLPTRFDLYRARGLGKTVPYPKDPAAEF